MMMRMMRMMWQHQSLATRMAPSMTQGSMHSQLQLSGLIYRNDAVQDTSKADMQLDELCGGSGCWVDPHTLVVSMDCLACKAYHVPMQCPAFACVGRTCVCV